MEIFTSSHRDRAYSESNVSMGTNIDMNSMRPTSFWRTKSDDGSGESTFGDQDCGEPESVQKLVVNFTPDPERDTLFEQQKCSDFWMFIRKQRNLKFLKVYPNEMEPTIENRAPRTETASDSKGATSSDLQKAISFFSLPANQDRLCGALATDMRGSDCSFRASQYTIKDVYKIPNEEKKHCKICPKPDCNPAFCFCPKPRANKKGPQPTPRTLCKIFDDWDKKHPKSMEPSGHPPLLVKQCKLQRLA